MTTLITGGNGVLARELSHVFEDIYSPTKESMNIIDKDKVNSVIRERKPDLLIHAAALTGIRPCEENPKLAYSTNVIGTSNLVKACEEFSQNTKFVYISTACVFRGDRGNYKEDDVPYPKNYYALTKLLGEFIVNQSRLNWLIIRTNFVGRKQWPYPKAFSDRYGTYLFADNLSLAIKDVLSKGITGVVHVCGEKILSVYELARMTSPNVSPMTLAEYEGPPLTVNMTLVSSRIEPYKITSDPVTKY